MVMSPRVENEGGFGCGHHPSFRPNSSTPIAITRTLQAPQISRKRSALILSLRGTSAASNPGAALVPAGIEIPPGRTMWLHF